MTSIPMITAEMSTLDAALAYAAAGFYVGPVKRGTKHPGSVIGDPVTRANWQRHTSRDVDVISAWYSGTDHGIFLHAGRSGCVIFDVDEPDKLHPAIRQAIEQYRPPYQSTRLNRARRGHYLFGQPPGRTIGNSLGQLAGGWGEIRGLNGVIIAAPSEHEEAAAGGVYQWQQTGPVPELPGYLSTQLPDALEAAETATDGQVAAFLGEHTSRTRPELLDIHAAAYSRKIAAGESRHDTMPGHLAGAMKEAAAGLLHAQEAADTLERLFLDVVAQPPLGPKQGKARTGAVARNEWRGLLAWAVAQGRAADPTETLLRVADKVPQLTELVGDLSASGEAVTPRLAGVAASVESLDGVSNAEEPRRKVVLTPASEIQPRRVRWLWDGRLALGSLGLLAGREGVGKSTLAYWLAARVTRGELAGENLGTSGGVLVCATEDSWAHTIIPRLIAADADLGRVYRVEVVADSVHVGLSLPRDLPAVEAAASEVGAALLLLDPLMSRLDASLDSHRDHEVRLALEPLTGLADRAGLAVVGLIHHNKSGSTDPLQLVMGSRAFSAVARSVHTVMTDPDDETGALRLFGTPKNNLGRTDLPTLAFRVTSHAVDTDDGKAWTGRVAWADDSPVSIADAMRRAASDDRTEDRSAATEAADWLRDHLERQGGSGESALAKRAAKAAGHSDWALRRGRERLRVVVEQQVTSGGRVTLWSLPESLPAGGREGGREDSLGETLTTTPPPPPPLTRGDRVGRVGREDPPARPLTTPHEPVDECLCGAPLRTFVQKANGQCNRCYVRTVAGKSVDREPAA